MPTTDSILQVNAVCKSFFGVPVLKQVSFELRPGAILGLIGENGAGKSTLMNVLGGVLQPDSGQMFLSGQLYQPRTTRDAARAGVAFVHQELNLFTNLSIAENLHIGRFPLWRLARLPLPLIDRARMRDKTSQLLGQVDLRCAPDTLVEELSPGERQLVEVARAIDANARILILDEPTSSLSAPEAERLFAIVRRLQDQGVAVVYISHNLEDVFHLCNDLVVLRDGQVVGGGPCAEFTVSRAVSLMVGRSVDQLYPPRHAKPSEEPLLEVERVSRADVIHDATLSVHRGEIVGLAGLMGAGRTELAQIIFGLDPFNSGEIRVNGRCHKPSPRRSIRRGIALVTENRREDGLLMDASVSFNAALAALPTFTRRGTTWIRRKRMCRAVAASAAATRLSGFRSARQAVRTLSGGNQQKIVLAKWLLCKPSVFILDEPTRGIDVGARQEIYRIIAGLADGGAAVLVISSEIEELIGTCDRILVMSGGRIRDCLCRPEFDRERILRAAMEEGGRR